jgi:hypothetical protein
MAAVMLVVGGASPASLASSLLPGTSPLSHACLKRLTSRMAGIFADCRSGVFW